MNIGDETKTARNISLLVIKLLAEEPSITVAGRSELGLCLGKLIGHLDNIDTLSREGHELALEMAEGVKALKRGLPHA